MIVFDPLWETLRRKGVSQYALIKEHGVSTGTLDSLRKKQERYAEHHQRSVPHSGLRRIRYRPLHPGRRKVGSDAHIAPQREALSFPACRGGRLCPPACAKTVPRHSRGTVLLFLFYLLSSGRGRRYSCAFSSPFSTRRAPCASASSSSSPG